MPTYLFNRSHGRIRDVWDKVLEKSKPLPLGLRLERMGVDPSMPLASSAEILVEDMVAMDIQELPNMSDSDIENALHVRLIATLQGMRAVIDEFLERNTK